MKKPIPKRPKMIAKKPKSSSQKIKKLKTGKSVIRNRLVIAVFSVLIAIVGIRMLMPSNAAVPNGADQIIMWVGCKDFVNQTDAQLQQWKDRGVDGFVCATSHLRDMGGTQDYTGDPNHTLTGSNYDLQRSLRDTRIVQRAKAKGLKMYLSFYTVNYFNNATPLKDWFDDAGWNNVVIPKITAATSAAKLLGFDGVGLDQELYGRPEGAQRWPWNYPGSTRTEVEVRAKVKQRGQEVMTAMLKAYPNLDLVTYAYDLEGAWKSIVQKRYNNIDNFAKNFTFINWYDGLTSVEGYKAIHLISTDFHKNRAPAASWDIAMQYQANQAYSVLSRGLSNWDYASSRIHVTPFSWIDAGTNPNSTYDDARTPAQVAEQLTAMRKWGTGGQFFDFAFNPVGTFDFTPYNAVMSAASTAATVDTQAPVVRLTAPTTGTTYTASGNTLSLSGNTIDNMAIRSVSWSNDRGGIGAAQMTWKIISGDYNVGYNWQMDWNIASIPLLSGTNVITITALDIKGMTTSYTLTVQAPSGSATPVPPPTTTTRPTTTTPPPTTKQPAIKIISPSNGTTITAASTPIKATATSDSAITKMIILIDGRNIAFSSTGSITYNMGYAAIAKGRHTITVKAFDKAGKVSEASITIYK